jgi:hypothetical protein
MKKIYILALVVFGFAFTANAQFEDDFEDYLAGPISDQSPLWGTWSGGTGDAEDALVSTDQASNGVNAVHFVGGNDMLLSFGPTVGGTFTWQYKVWLTDGSSGFLGTMSESTVAFGLQMRFNDATVGTTFTNAGNAVVGDPFVIPQEEWVTFSWAMDLDADTVVVTMNGDEIYDDVLELGGTFDVVDIWADDANTDFFMDEVVFVEGVLGATDFNENLFSVYPNPVVNTLNISSKAVVNSVVVYDLLGKIVVNTTSNAVSPAIDMSQLASGTYLVNVTIGDASKTIKVIK